VAEPALSYRELVAVEDEHLLRLRLMDVEIEDADAWLWMTDPHPQLDGLTPQQVITIGQRERLEPIIDDIEDKMWDELEAAVAAACAF
jgi:hypothetical protein